MAANDFLQIFFLKSSFSVNLRSFMIEQYAHLLSLFLIQGRTHCLRFLLSFIYVFRSVTNHLKKSLTILSVYCYLWPPFNITALFTFSLWKALVSKIFQNILKIFLIVIVLYILRILLCVTIPLDFLRNI